MYALRFDGFVQYGVYKSLKEAKEAYNRAVKNPMLYEYDCIVVELDGRKVVRVLSVEELTSR